MSGPPQGMPEGLPAGLAGQMGGVSSSQARQMQQQQQQQEAMKDQRSQMLLAVLDNAARARLKSVALVKPERANRIEDQVLNLARTGRIQGQLGEEAIVSMLKQLAEADSKKAAVKVSFSRRRTGWSDDDSDDNDDDLL
jgi:programmed cell death protein 5